MGRGGPGSVIWNLSDLSSLFIILIYYPLYIWEYFWTTSTFLNECDLGRNLGFLVDLFHEIKTCS